MRRYVGLLMIQLKAASLLSLQYRLDFFVQTAMAVIWTLTALVPLWVLFSMRSGVAGWTAHEALIVAGFFIALKGALQGVIQPSLTNVVEHIRKGTLDFLLLKPVDTQFLLSTSKLDLPRAVDVLTGIALAIWALAKSGAHPSATEVVLAALILLCALPSCTASGSWSSASPFASSRSTI